MGAGLFLPWAALSLGLSPRHRHWRAAQVICVVTLVSGGAGGGGGGGKLDCNVVATGRWHGKAGAYPGEKSYRRTALATTVPCGWWVVTAHPPPPPQARTLLGVIQYPSLPRGWPHRRSGARRNRYRGGSAHPRRWQSVCALMPPVWRGGPHYRTWGANRGGQPPATPASSLTREVPFRGGGPPARGPLLLPLTRTEGGGRVQRGNRHGGGGGGGNPAATVAKDLRGGLVVGLPSIRPPRRMPNTAATTAPPAVPMV